MKKILSIFQSVVTLAVRLIPLIALAAIDLTNMERSYTEELFFWILGLKDKLHPVIYEIIDSATGYIMELIFTFRTLDAKPGQLICWILAGILPYIALLYTMFFWKKNALRNVQAVYAVIHIVMRLLWRFPELIAEFHPKTNSIVLGNYAGRIGDRAMLGILVCILAVFINWSIECLKEKIPQWIDQLKEKVKL